MEQINIYLDQKDYSNIARGLYGEKKFESYIEIFKLLKNLLESGRIIIYFSWSHIIESLRYYDLTSELWKIHCEVVDTLTKGKCIIFPTSLRERELELFLSDYFGVKSKYSKIDYAFGFFKDAFVLKNIDIVPSNNFLEKAYKKHISSLSLSRNDRRMLLKKFSKKRNRRELFKNMSDDDFNRLLGGLNESDHPKELINDLSNFLDRETFINFVVGTPNYRSQIFNEFLDHIFNFKSLVNIYSQIFPELKKMAKFPDEPFDKINSIIRSAQLFQEVFSKPAIDPDKLKSNLTNKYVRSLGTSINKFAKKHKFSKKEAEKILFESHLMPLPSIYADITFCAEYARIHDSSSKRKRKPRLSDIMDLHNLRNIPFVNVFVTDGFFAEIIGKIATEQFGTKIFRNLFQLKDFLQYEMK